MVCCGLCVIVSGKLILGMLEVEFWLYLRYLWAYMLSSSCASWVNTCLSILVFFFCCCFLYFSVISWELFISIRDNSSFNFCFLPDVLLDYALVCWYSNFRDFRHVYVFWLTCIVFSFPFLPSHQIHNLFSL